MNTNTPIISILLLLFIIFLAKISQIKFKRKLNLPYCKKEHLMTEAEREFFKVLKEVIRDKSYIVPQVQLSKIVGSKSWEYAYRNKIDRKSVDFVLFNNEYFTPQLVIELDDKSHLREDRQARDNFVDEVLSKVGIKIVHIKTSHRYNLDEISKLIKPN